jgi:hypothetical protein
MTSRRELSYAVSLTELHRWGTAARCLELIAGATDDLARPVELSQRDIAEWLGLKVRTVGAALARLREWGMVEYLDRAGREGSRWRVVDPLDWSADAPWAIDRREVVVHLAAFSHLESRAQSPVSAREASRALALLRREKSQLESPDSDLCAREAPRAQSTPSARPQPRAQTGPFHLSSRDPSDLSIDIDRSRDRAPLSERGEALAEAIREATGKPVVGELEARIGALADRCNGSFPSVLFEARKPGLKSPWTSLVNLERLAERLAQRPAPQPRGKPEPSLVSLTNRLSMLQQQRRVRELTDDEADELRRLSEQFGEPIEPSGTIRA